MSCGCKKSDRTQLWTPIPEFKNSVKAADEMLPGENMDCFMKKPSASTIQKNGVAEKIPGKIENTALVTDLNGKVDAKFNVNGQTAQTWRVWVNGQPGIPAGMGTNFNTATGDLTGTVADSFANKNYKVVVKGFDGQDKELDSKEFNFFPKKGTKEDTVKFVFPYSPNGRVTCGFGPRVAPTARASSKHQGIDISQPGDTRGDILSAADGVVVQVGPKGGYGNWIVIKHEDSAGKLVATTVYGHMEASTIAVKVGDKVSAGQKIAQEGNAGVGTAAHLHFELHKGDFGNPVDPLPYLNGSIQVANDNLPGQPGVPNPAAGTKTLENKNNGMTSLEKEGMPSTTAKTATFEPSPGVTVTNPVASGGGGAGGNDCPSSPPNQLGNSGSQSTPDSKSTATPRGPVSPEPPSIPISSNPSKAQTQSEIQRALEEDSSLTAADKKHLMFVANIESGYKADAKNPSTSARGVYQMVDKTAEANYKRIGVEATEANRNDPYLATKAQIAFYKAEQKPAWESFQASGGTKINGKTLAPEVAAKYATLNQGEFTYGLIHHDGSGNATSGKDQGGVNYYREQVRKTAT